MTFLNIFRSWIHENEINAPDLIREFEEKKKKRNPDWKTRVETNIPIPPCNFKPGEKLHVLADHEVDNEELDAEEICLNDSKDLIFLS